MRCLPAAGCSESTTWTERPRLVEVLATAGGPGYHAIRLPRFAAVCDLVSFQVRAAQGRTGRAGFRRFGRAGLAGRVLWGAGAVGPNGILVSFFGKRAHSVALPVEIIQAPWRFRNSTGASAPHPLKLIVRWLNTLHPQVDFRLCSVMRRVGEVPKQPFETSQISRRRANHGIQPLGCHCRHRLIAKLE